MIYENFGYWSLQTGLVDIRTTRILSRRRKNLKGHLLKAPMVFPHANSEKHLDLDDYRLVEHDIYVKKAKI